MNPNKYKFESRLWRIDGSSASYVIFPGDAKKIFGKGLVYVSATVDDLAFDCCIINKGYDHFEGKPTYIISINNDKLMQIGKYYGDTVTVTVKERERNK